MFVVVGDTHRTAYTLFEDTLGHRIGFLGTVHYGEPSYYTALQAVIDSWDGIIYVEQNSGEQADSPILEREITDKQWSRCVKLMRLIIQRPSIKCPEERVEIADISYSELADLYKTVSLDAPTDRDGYERVVGLLESQPDAAYTVLRHFNQIVAKGVSWGQSHDWSHHRTWANIRDEFDAIGMALEENRAVPDTVRFVFNVLAYIFAYESVWSFVPERDTKILRAIDAERVGARRSILLPYGSAHFTIIVSGLRDRSYRQVCQDWFTVASVPRISLKECIEGIATIAR